MKKIFFTMIAVAACAVTVMAQCVYPTDNVTINFKRKIPGALMDGEFSVSATKKVYFSQGNLQYTISTDTWSFMTHQYDKVETSSQNVGSYYGSQNIVSLFGWGTAGNSEATGAYQPNATTNSNAEYVKYLTTAGEWTATKSDWGINIGSGWRVLTTDEWGFLLNISNSSDPAVGRQGSRYAKATVHSVPGVIILPDGWTQAGSAMSATLAGINSSAAGFASISNDDWTKLESEGAVFLPAAGRRIGLVVYDVGADGRYWSSSALSATSAELFRFYTSNVMTVGNDRYYGCSVRLVQNVPAE